MNHSVLFLATIAFLLSGSSELRAGILYDNGAPAGLGLDGINSFYPPMTVSDSFTLSGLSNVTQVQLALSGSSPVSVQWSIGTTAFGNDIGSGVGNLTNKFSNFGGNGSGFGLQGYLSTFTLNETMAAGTYWLTISNGIAGDGGLLFWALSGGPSQSSTGGYSDSFQILGDPVTSTPEPSSLLLAALGASGVAWYRRREIRRMAPRSIPVLDA